MNELTTVGRFHIQQKIGSGGSATLYMAIDPNSGNQVAIKLMNESLSENQMARTRFRREAELVVMLQHPAIVPIYDLGEINGRLFVTMAYMEGGSIRDRLRYGPMSYAATVAILERIAPAIDAAHENQVLHRDIKPHNILLDRDGQAYLSDFGIARLVDADNQQRTATMIGTPEFMAPEQIMEGELTPQTDVYQLGVTLFNMLTGTYPFRGSAHQIMSQQVSAERPNVEALVDGLPAGIGQIIMRAMAINPSERYPNAAALLNALHHFGDAMTNTMFVPFDNLAITPATPLSQPVFVAPSEPSEPPYQPSGARRYWQPVLTVGATLGLTALLFISGFFALRLAPENVLDTVDAFVVELVDAPIDEPIVEETVAEPVQAIDFAAAEEDVDIDALLDELLGEPAGDAAPESEDTPVETAETEPAAANETAAPQSNEEPPTENAPPPPPNDGNGGGGRRGPRDGGNGGGNGGNGGGNGGGGNGN